MTESAPGSGVEEIELLGGTADLPSSSTFLWGEGDINSGSLGIREVAKAGTNVFSGEHGLTIDAYDVGATKFVGGGLMRQKDDRRLKAK